MRAHFIANMTTYTANAIPDPIPFGDANEIVAVLYLNRESLEFIANELPIGDGFTRMVFEALEEVDRQLAPADSR